MLFRLNAFIVAHASAAMENTVADLTYTLLFWSLGILQGILSTCNLEKIKARISCINCSAVLVYSLCQGINLVLQR